MQRNPKLLRSRILQDKGCQEESQAAEIEAFKLQNSSLESINLETCPFTSRDISVDRAYSKVGGSLASIQCSIGRPAYHFTLTGSPFGDKSRAASWSTFFARVAQNQKFHWTLACPSRILNIFTELYGSVALRL